MYQYLAFVFLYLLIVFSLLVSDVSSEFIKFLSGGQIISIGVLLLGILNKSISPNEANM